MNLRSPICAIALLAASVVPAAAQVPAGVSRVEPLAVGTRVRLRTGSTEARVSGLIVAADAEKVTVATDAGAVQVPVNRITSIDVSLGKRRHTLRGLAIGAAVGLVMDLVAAARENPSPTPIKPTTTVQDGGYALVSGVLIGPLIGALIKTDRWTPVAVGVGPVRSPSGRPGMGFSATMRF